MIQGLRKKYKQPEPVAYYFCGSSTHVEKLTMLIKEVISSVEEAGFKVISTVCDLGSNFVLALETLGSTWEKPWFEFNGHKIYTIYDVCHLLKCTRNNFRRRGITFRVKIKGRRYAGNAKWDHIRKVVNEDRKQVFQGLRHIKDKHLDPVGAQKMKLNLAAQIFSKTMSSNIADQHDYGILKGDDSAELACCVCNLFDDTYDALNGQGTIPYKGKRLRKRMEPGSLHYSQLLKAQRFINNMEYVGKKKTNRPPSHNGWLATLRAVRYIYDDLRKEGFNYLDTKRLNSDPIECQFGAFRCNCGGNNERPDVPQFEGGFKTSVLNNTTSSNVKGNCEYDNVQLLNDLKVFLFNEDKESDTEKSVQKVVDQVDTALGPILARTARLKAAVKAGDYESHPTAHIAGFVANQIVKKLKCTICCNRLLAESLGPCHSLIKAKEYNREKRSLTYCCEKFVEIGSWLCSLLLRRPDRAATPYVSDQSQSYKGTE